MRQGLGIGDEVDEGNSGSQRAGWSWGESGGSTQCGAAFGRQGQI